MSLTGMFYKLQNVNVANELITVFIHNQNTSRNNKLTELLQDSIGGNAKTLFIINVSPSRSNLDETLVSLNYGMRIKQVVNYPQRANNSNNSKEVAGPESHTRSRK